MLVVLAVVGVAGLTVDRVLRSDSHSSDGLGAAGTSHPPTIQPITVDDTSGPTFARRTPATLHPPGGGTVSVVVADPLAHQRLPPPPSGAVVARMSSNGLRFEAWATGGVLDQEQVDDLVRIVAAGS